MARFKKKRGKSTPAISTASLPDIIFMLLFFFMVTTVMRESELKLSVNVPSATELTKLENKSLVHTIYIGRPLPQYQRTYGTAPRLQLNDKISDLSAIPFFIETEKTKLPERDHKKMKTSLRVDGTVTMGIVADVKEELRKSGQLLINYSARKK